MKKEKTRKAGSHITDKELEYIKNNTHLPIETVFAKLNADRPVEAQLTRGNVQKHYDLFTEYPDDSIAEHKKRLSGMKKGRNKKQEFKRLQDYTTYELLDELKARAMKHMMLIEAIKECQITSNQ